MTENLLSSLNESLIKYGLSQIQARVYLFLSKNGEMTAPQISSVLKIARTQTYHVLTQLQKKEICLSIKSRKRSEKTTKFKTVPLEASLKILIKTQKEIIFKLEENKENVCQTWNKWTGEKEFQRVPIS
jgi:sugar-specific transcriptional regulator TrmB